MNLLKYSFKVSGPFPDENGVIMNGMAFRVKTLKGEAQAYNIQEATRYVLNNSQVKDIADYHGIEIEKIINGTDSNAPNMLSMSLLDNGMSVCFLVTQKENM